MKKMLKHPQTHLWPSVFHEAPPITTQSTELKTAAEHTRLQHPKTSRLQTETGKNAYSQCNLPRNETVQFLDTC